MLSFLKKSGVVIVLGFLLLAVVVFERKDITS